MGKALTNAQINLDKFTEEIGKGVSSRGVDHNEEGPKEITVEGLSDTEIAKALQEHVYDPDFGKPIHETRLRKMVDKADKVLAREDNFTQVEMQVLTAAIVVRLLRG